MFLQRAKSLIPSRWQSFAGAVLLGCLMAASPNSAQAARPTGINLIPTVTGITLTNGQLLASGNVSAIVNGVTNLIPFSGVPVNLSLATNQTGAGACPILDLQLAPITLDLLGLIVETSPICLQVTAYDGGGLLGSLLCSVAGLLDGGLNLGQILSGTGLPAIPGLTGTELTTLLGGVQNLLNGVLGNLLNAAVTAAERGHGHDCGILHLELGPLDLTLLGLNVHLDDCADGPVVVDISAENGQGNLLGNLLCGLLRSNRIDLGTTLQQLLGLLTR